MHFYHSYHIYIHTETLIPGIGIFQIPSEYPVSTRHRPNDVLMLAHRLRRWPNIKPTLGKRLLVSEWP